MAFEELRIGNRAAYFRKAISNPHFGTDSVLTIDIFTYVDLWLKRNVSRTSDAHFFWSQAREYFDASDKLTLLSRPVTQYYGFLNAVKALLTVTGAPYNAYHGMSGKAAATRRELVNEQTTLKKNGVVIGLAKYLQEADTGTTYNLKDILAELPFIHRAYCLTYRSDPELFIPVRKVRYEIDKVTSEVKLTAEITGKFNDGRYLRQLPGSFVQDATIEGKCVIRSAASILWFRIRDPKTVKAMALQNLKIFHRLLRSELVCISSATDLWYLRRSVASKSPIRRYGLTLMLMGMHRLSELTRYDPKGLAALLSGKRNWLLSEFLELAPRQFLTELACELTGEEFRIPGVRP